MENDNTPDAGERAATERSVPGQMRPNGSARWERVEQTSAFKELGRRKRSFVVPAEIFAVVFFMSWPLLGAFTTVLDGRAIGAMTWASVYGFAQFAMILTILHLYLRQAAGWDKLVEDAGREASEGRTSP